MKALQDASVVDFSAELISRALSQGASAAQAQTIQSRRFEMQFDNQGVDLVRSTENDASLITVFHEGRRGAARLNGRSSEVIDFAIASALAAAAAGITDEANGVADAESMPASHHGPESADRQKMLVGVEAFLTRTRAEYPLLRTRDCYHAFDEQDMAFANSRGVHQRERRAHYGFGAFFMAKDGARTSSFNFCSISSFTPFEDPLSAGGVKRLISETTRSLYRKVVPKKFEGDVIVTPECLSGLIESVVSALSGEAILAGTTPFLKKKGELIASPLLSLSNLPKDEGSPSGSDFDDYGVPTRNLEIISNGVLNDYLIDFYFARKLGLLQTAGCRNLSIASGTTPVSDIVANTKRGILFSRFSGAAPNSNLDFVGLAKNSFYIEDGEILYALGETMVSGNLEELLKSVRVISQETVDFGRGRFPFLAASGVTISSN